MGDSEFYIRRVQESDLKHILHWENNIEGWNLHDNDKPYTPVDILMFISDQLDIYRAKQVRWIICLGNLPIGAVDLTDIDFEKGSASVGILIAEEKHRGKGYAGKALKLLEIEAVQLGINHLLSSIHPANEISIALFKKLDYIECGKGDTAFLLNGVNLVPLEFEKWLKK